MTIEQGAGEAHAVVKIRTSRYDLILPLVMAGLFVSLAVSALAGGDQLDFGPVWLAGAAVIVAESLWTLTWGVDLTPESANLRGVRRRSIPWQEVQTVLLYERIGSRMVRLIPEKGKPVTLRAPTSLWGLGGAAYERDFHRIGQGWLEHRGVSWRPLRPEAPCRPCRHKTRNLQMSTAREN